MSVVGDLIWAPDPTEAFVEAKVTEIKGSKVVVTIQATEATAEFEKTDVHERPQHEHGVRVPVAEMDELTPLNMAEVLDNVSTLFHGTQADKPGKGISKIYSSVGPVLIAMNPFEELPIYDKVWKQEYHNAGGNAVVSRKLGPHAYRTAEEALQGLKSCENQAVIICGESGAGKTVTNRKMLEYLCEVTHEDGGSQGADPAKITQANMCLESFGNAATTRNDNSSRFGKFTSLYFSGGKGSYKVTGCGATHYLLERSRIVGAPKDERNYHIFYQLIRSGEGKKYGLEDGPEKYAYCAQGADVFLPGVDDKADFETLKQGLAKGNFEESFMTHIFECVASVLQLGNVQVSGDHSSSTISAASLAPACSLLGIDKTKMSQALTHKMLKVPGSAPIPKDVGKAAAEAQRDTVAKMVYSRMFDWIVAKIDENLRGDCDTSGACIGLLDIFGFEDMAVNGFEQLFINFTNERIQHLFNTIMFDREKEVYNKEGINADFLKGPRNIDCVNLFLGKKPAGIVQLISDQCRTGQEDEKVDGEVLCRVLNKAFGRGNDHYRVCDFKEVNKVLEKKGLRKKGGKGLSLDYKECFEIVHYAGPIMYTVQNFVPKSRDSLVPEITAILAASTKEQVAQMFKEDEDHHAAATVGQKFREQLNELAETLDAGDALFVRCIKSNMKKVPNQIERQMVLEQLTRGGVVAALEMRAAGLPDRLEYADFVTEFGLLQRGKEKLEAKAGCQTILRDLLGEKEAQHAYKFGSTKVFMKSGILAWLRGASYFKKMMLARRIQRKLWFSRVHKITKAWETLKGIEQYAVSRGLENLKAVKKFMSDAKGMLEPVNTALEKAKEKHGKNYEAIAGELAEFKSVISKMLSTVDEGGNLVEKYALRKSEVETAMNTRIAKAQSHILDLLRRIDAVEEDSQDCSAVADKDDLEKCAASCKSARDNLLKLQKETLPEFQKTTPAASAVDLEAEPWHVDDPCPKIGTLMKEAEGLVTKTEDLSFAVLKVRRAFQEAMKDLDDQLSENRSKLESLAEAGRNCVAEGLDDVVNFLNKAHKLNTKLEALELECQDPDGFRATAAEYVQAVKEAAEAVQAAEAELARREAERAERLALIEKLDEISAKISEAQVSLLKEQEKIVGGGDALAGATSKLVQEVLPEVPRLRQRSGEDLSTWKPEVEALVAKSNELMEQVELMVAEGKRKSKAKFESLKKRFSGK